MTGAPEWLGGLLVAVVVTGAVAAGGMRSITFVQAFQYWLKLTALLVPALFLVAAWCADDAPRARFDAPAVLREHTTVRLDDTVRVSLDAPLTVTVTGSVDTAAYHGERVTLAEGLHRVEAGTTLGFAPGPPYPSAPPATATPSAGPAR